MHHFGTAFSTALSTAFSTAFCAAFCTTLLHFLIPKDIISLSPFILLIPIRV